MKKKLVILMIIFTCFSNAALANISPSPLKSYEVVALLLKSIGTMKVSDLEGVIYPQVSAADKLAQAMLAAKNISASCTTEWNSETLTCQVLTAGKDPETQGDVTIGSPSYSFYFKISKGQVSPTVAIVNFMR